MSSLLLANRGSAAARAAASGRRTAGSATRTTTTRRAPPLLLWRGGAAPTSSASTSSSAPAQSPAAAAPNPTAPVAGLSVRVARTAAELRAAAYLRAAAFGAYPPGRSEFAARQHRRMRGDAEWEAVTAKVEGKEPAYARLRVACLIATAPVPSPHAAAGEGGGGEDEPAEAEPGASEAEARENAALAARLASDSNLDPSAALLPVGGLPPATEAVVGTLDVNIGAVLPAEELAGKRGRVGDAAAPPPPPPPSTRGYLSNVCVAKAARGLGVGKALLRAAEDLVVRPVDEGGLLAVPPLREEEAGGGDTSSSSSSSSPPDPSFHLYVHVVHDNAAARALYEGASGFRVEAEETEAFARGLARPRRLLLHKLLPLNPTTPTPTPAEAS